jgi:hypothetical protein
MGGYLEIKLVKPSKVVSRTPNKGSFGQIRLPKAQAQERTAGAWVLREPDTAMGQELRCFDPADGVLDQLPELGSLFGRDLCTEVLDLDQAFADEYDLGDVRDAGDPGIADQLWVKHQQSGNKPYGINSG